jgi:hypothetical protein
MTSTHWPTPMKRRVKNAAVLLGVGVIVVGGGWLLSMGLYYLGLWPLGALLRLGVWGFALFCAYWMFRHLVIGEAETTRRDLERWRMKSDR